MAAAACHGTKANDIVDTAVSAGNFKTLAVALQAAGLVDTLIACANRVIHVIDGVILPK
jgi:uncharacterized surface protein with fasciclin (FAS1) repeats